MPDLRTKSYIHRSSSLYPDPFRGHNFIKSDPDILTAPSKDCFAEPNGQQVSNTPFCKKVWWWTIDAVAFLQNPQGYRKDKLAVPNEACSSERAGPNLEFSSKQEKRESSSLDDGRRGGGKKKAGPRLQHMCSVGDVCTYRCASGHRIEELGSYYLC